jgi:excisionase family DNA binding protein
MQCYKTSNGAKIPPQLQQRKQEGRDMAIEKLYSVPEAAEALRVSKWTIWAWLSQAKLKRTKCQGKTVIRESELLKLLKD